MKTSLCPGLFREDDQQPIFTSLENRSPAGALKLDTGPIGPNKHKLQQQWIINNCSTLAQ